MSAGSESTPKGPRESLIQYEAFTEAEHDMTRSDTFQTKHQIQLPPLESKPSIEDIIKAILLPREWNENGRHYVQYVSHAPASREDVANLQKLLDQRLLARQAREELHSQCFDEIIRQVTIDSPERGILLLRVRDELKMTIAAYQTLYESSVTFGIRKQLQGEQGRSDLEMRIEELEKNKAELEDKRIELLNKKEAFEKQIKERRDLEEFQRKAEIDFLKYQSQHLENFLKSVTTI